MPITFPCACGEQLEVGDEQAGGQARCPFCNAVVSVPAGGLPKQPKRAKVVEPDDTDDDKGAYASSLNPHDRRNRPSSRRRDEDDEDDDRPRKRKRDDDEDDRDADYRPRRRRAYDDDDDDRPRMRRRRNEPPPYNLFNKQTIGGVVMILIGVTVTVVLLFFDIIWFWMLILTVVGFISLIRGLVTGRDQ